jgi:hypothetical protein
MAWGTNTYTEDESERLAAVRDYFQQQFPGCSIRDLYDAGRMAQVFRIETNEAETVHNAVVSTEFLEGYPPSKIGKVLLGYRVAEHLRSAKSADVLVTNWGVEDKEG